MSEQTEIQFKGLVRFSYLAATANRAKGEIDAQALARLFDPDRMDLQFGLFEYFTIPSLRRQTDQSFAMVILTSEGLPEPVLDRLLGHAEKMPRLTVQTLPPLPLADAAGRAFRLIPDDPAATHIATFRLEEDAGLHDQALAHQRRRAMAHLQTHDPDTPFALSFNRGLTLNLGAGAGDPRLFDLSLREPQANGLTLVAPLHDRLHVYRHPPNRMMQHVDLLSEVGLPMYLQAVPEEKPVAGLRSPAEAAPTEDLLKSGFGLSYQELEFG